PALDEIATERPLHHLCQVPVVAADERQVEDVELVTHRAHGTDRNARELQSTELRLLDHLLLAPELHQGIHLQRDAAAGRGLDLLAHAHDGLDRRIAERMHIGRLPHRLLLGKRIAQGRSCGERCGGTGLEHVTPFHWEFSFGWIFSNRSQHLLQRLVVCNHHTTCGRGERQGSSSPTRRRCSATITVSGPWRACANSARSGCTRKSIRSRAKRSSRRRKAAKSSYRTSRPPGMRPFSKRALSSSRSCAARWTSARSTSRPRAARACSSRGRARASFPR